MAHKILPDPFDDEMAAAFAETPKERRYWRNVALVLIGLILAMWLVFELTRPAAAQLMMGQSCAKHDEISAMLKQKYSERPSAMGLQANGDLMQVFSSETGSWTVVVTNPEGWSCIMAGGKSWQSMSTDPEV